jgi:PST family polysaccharide transporter
MLIGGLLGTLKLGWYAMAFQIRTIPDSIISGPVYASLIPVIGRNSSDSNAVRKLFLSAISTISVIIFPISVGMSLTADFSIPLILGEKWPPSVKLLEILAVASGANCLAMAVGVCLLAIGHSRAQMALTGYLTAASVVAVPLGLPWGTPGVAVAILIASLSAWPFYLYTAKQKFGRTHSRYSHYAMALSIIICRKAIVIGLDRLIILPTCMALGGIIYFGFIAIFGRKLLSDSLALFQVSRT